MGAQEGSRVPPVHETACCFNDRSDLPIGFQVLTCSAATFKASQLSCQFGKFRLPIFLIAHAENEARLAKRISFGFQIPRMNQDLKFSLREFVKRTERQRLSAVDCLFRSISLTSVCRLGGGSSFFDDAFRFPKGVRVKPADIATNFSFQRNDEFSPAPTGDKGL